MVDVNGLGLHLLLRILVGLWLSLEVDLVEIVLILLKILILRANVSNLLVQVAVGRLRHLGALLALFVTVLSSLGIDVCI